MPESTIVNTSDGDDDKALAKLLFRASLFLMIAYTVLISMRLVLAPMHSQGLLPIIGAYAVFLSSMTLSWFRIRVRLVAHVMIATIAVLVIFRSYVAGGTDSPVLIMNIMLSVAAVFLLGRTAGLAYSLVMMLAICVFVGMRLNNYEFPGSELEPKLLEVMQGVVIIFVMSVCTWIAWLYARDTEILTQTLLDQARRDHLTGVPNRRAFDFALEKEIRLAKRHGTDLTLFIVDLDFFKSFNDLYGHHDGDQCLVNVAGIIQSCLRRPGDMVARYGGEEFVVILPDTPLEQARQLAETMRHAVLGLNIAHKESPYGVVTITLGASKLDLQKNMRADELFRQSDEALYKGKEAGRNRVVVYEQP